MRPKTDAQIELMRQGGRKLAKILDELKGHVKVGANGKDISTQAAELIKQADLTPVVLGYQGFPDVICVSVNEAVVHGIPGKKTFADGDLVKLDLAVGYKGLVIDSAITVRVGNSQPSNDVQRLLEGTQKALMAGIKQVKPGAHIGDVSAAIQEVLEDHQLGIVRDLVGHGVGYDVHEDPEIPNYGRAGTGRELFAGLTLAIEPMATLGDWRVNVLNDGWTVVTRDSSLTAQFEHTVLVTEDGSEILTKL